MKTETKVAGFDVQIRENGSINHPFYVRIFVDGYLVAEKSFMSLKKAEAGKDAFVARVLVDMTRKLRNMSKTLDSLQDSKINYPGRTPFYGTGHYDDEQ